MIFTNSNIMHKVTGGSFDYMATCLYLLSIESDTCIIVI